jgi:UDP-sulfoquinovose synthase
MNVLILGGDGYLGWPTAMHLAEHGHNVFVVDNYLRRNLAREEDVEPLYALPNLVARCHIWEQVGGKPITPIIGNLRDWSFVETVFKRAQPDVIIHYAEQPSAPYSMLNRHAASLTLSNNLEVTANTIFAVREFVPNAHIIKLGTMGEYGTPNIDIEEGWIDITHNDRTDKFLFPRQAGSLYHTTKIMDTDLLWYYVRVWDLRVTDLMQGPVYGMYTKESRKDDRLLPHFAYDELFGTVVNRFIVQATIGYPLTVYGKGGQTRGYLNIEDTLQCVCLALETPAKAGELRVFNQFVETFSVNDIAERVREAGKAIGLKVDITSIDNPRKEREEHYYNPKHTGLLELGLRPHPMTMDVLAEMLKKVLEHKDNVHQHKIFRNTRWA